MRINLLLEELRALREYGPKDPDTGICGNISKGARHTLEYLIDHSDIYTAWPEYSGRTMYPVPAPNKHDSAMQAFNDAVESQKMWPKRCSKENAEFSLYQKSRLRLLTHLIKWLEAKLQHAESESMAECRLMGRKETTYISFDIINNHVYGTTLDPDTDLSENAGSRGHALARITYNPGVKLTNVHDLDIGVYLQHREDHYPAFTEVIHTLHNKGKESAMVWHKVLPENDHLVSPGEQVLPLDRRSEWVYTAWQFLTHDESHYEGQAARLYHALKDGSLPPIIDVKRKHEVTPGDRCEIGLLGHVFIGTVKNVLDDTAEVALDPNEAAIQTVTRKLDQLIPHSITQEEWAKVTGKLNQHFHQGKNALVRRIYRVYDAVVDGSIQHP